MGNGRHASRNERSDCGDKSQQTFSDPPCYMRARKRMSVAVYDGAKSMGDCHLHQYARAFAIQPMEQQLAIRCSARHEAIMCLMNNAQPSFATGRLQENTHYTTQSCIYL
eukprot:865821-Amphidinium_carterae.2